MPQVRKVLASSFIGLGAAAVLFAAPAAADTSLIPSCEGTAGSGGAGGGDTTVCASEGNSQIVATPRVLPGENEFYGFPAFGFI